MESRVDSLSISDLSKEDLRHESVNPIATNTANTLAAGYLPAYFSHRLILIFGLLLSIVATILLPFADAPDTYWRFVFPAFVLGTSGMIIVTTNGSIALFAYTPPSVAGTVGAVFTCALQLGSAVGLAAVLSITT
ncbi:hypothetical protein FRC18_002899 [Serendipita sp. 400]|nr:hypothetical protein FRC18_002899 [Serendipita sp. 400]